MHQPGVEVRPLRQMNGHATFNEVFLTDARVRRRPPWSATAGEGWRVAVTTLMHERGAVAGRHGAKCPKEQPGGRTVREADAEAAEYRKTYKWYPQRAGRST